MKRFSPIASIILGIIFVDLFTFILPAMSLLESLIIIIPIAISGGFIATFYSKTNKAIYGLYVGIIYSLWYIPIIIYTKDLIYLLFLVLFMIIGFIGGYIGMIGRKRLDNENNDY